MPQYNQGDVIRDYFSLIDEDNEFITGANFVTGVTEDPDGLDFPLDIQEIGGGLYRVSFLASKVGTYYYRVDTVGLVLNQSYEETFTVGPVTLYGSAIGTAAYGNSLNDLVQQVAVMIGDFLSLTATEDGASDGTSFRDQLRLSAIPAGALKGASITIVSPANSENFLQERRVIDSSEADTILTIYPGFPAKAALGEQAWITNLYSRGFWRQQYTDAINNVISAAQNMHLVPVSYTYPDTFYSDDPYVPTPQHLTHIYGVQYYNADGWEVDVPFSDQNLRTVPGWSIDFSTANILFNGSWPSVMNGMSVRFLGYGRPAKLVNPDDYTTIPSSFLVPAAASLLKLSKGDQKQLAPSQIFNNASQEAIGSLVTQVNPNTIRIR